MITIALSVIGIGVLVTTTVLTMVSIVLQAGAEFIKVLMNPLS